MPAPGDDRPIDPATAAPFPIKSGCGGPKINPVTGLSTDYLNHFTEAVMLLELASGMPECMRDLKAAQDLCRAFRELWLEQPRGDLRCLPGRRSVGTRGARS
jgi:hypothetical protein